MTFIRRTLPLCLLCLVVGATPAFAKTGDTGACGLLWRIGPKTETASYLFGTIHSEDPRVLDLPEPVTRAFRHSDTFVMEVIPDFATMAALRKTMYFRDQRNLKKVLEEELYHRTVDALRSHGVGAGLAIKMKPWAAAVTLSFPKPETGLFLDMMLYNRARKRGKETIGLESAREQMAFFRGLSLGQQVALLKKTLARRDKRKQAFEKLIEAWLARQPEKLVQMNRQYLRRLPGELAHAFRQKMIVERNRRMARRLEPILAQGDAFIAVGALHLYGAKGLIELLKGRGYSLECVY